MADHKENEPQTDDEQLLADAIPIDQIKSEESDTNAMQGKEDEDELAPIDLVEIDPSDQSSHKITSFDRTGERQQKQWARQPNKTGTGATHVKTFVAKLRLDAIDHLDEQINDWLDAHPETEVKFVTTTVGKLVGKITEEAVFVNLWI